MASAAVGAKRSFSTMSEGGMDSNARSPSAPLFKLQDAGSARNTYPHQQHNEHVDDSSMIHWPVCNTMLTEKQCFH
jgi:hypothetical protein